MAEDSIPGSRVHARTKHGSLTVDEIAEVQPGMSRLMDELSRRFWALYHAGKAGNWDLARYMTQESEKLLATMATVRPKYKDDLAAFRRDSLAPILAAIEARDSAGFEAACREAVRARDRFHVKYAKGFIRFRLPDHPPEWLDVGPR